MTNALPMIELANHAAAQSDRWLFVALLIVTLGAVALAARYMIRDRDRLIDTLGQHSERGLAMAKEVSAVVATNTATLERVADEIRFCAGRTGRGGPVALLLGALLLLGAGCAFNRVDLSSGPGAGGTNTTARVRSYAIWPATIDLAKQKISAGKTLSVGTEGLAADGGGTNISATLDSLTRLLQTLPR